MWARFPVVAFDYGLFGTGYGMFGRPGQVPGAVAGYGMWSSAPCVFPVVPFEPTRGVLQLLVDGLVVPRGALRGGLPLSTQIGSLCGLG